MTQLPSFSLATPGDVASGAGDMKKPFQSQKNGPR